MKLDSASLDDINSTLMGLMEDLDPDDDEAGQDDITPDCEDLYTEIDDWKQQYPKASGDAKAVFLDECRSALNAVDNNDFDKLSNIQAKINRIERHYRK